MHKRTLALIMGTRPEVIKFAPLVLALKQHPWLEPLVIASGQHSSMSEQAFQVFGIKPDIDLQIMEPAQSPSRVLGNVLQALEPVLEEIKPYGVVVQGDTTTALGGALAAFHLHIPIAHLEAGLRTFSLAAPFPEEMNRTLISKISTCHFCPTLRARENLCNEGIKENLHITGNTVVDAALLMKKRIDGKEVEIDPAVESLLLAGRKVVLVTGHRRENFDAPQRLLCQTLLQLRDAVEELEIIYPVHRNPRVTSTVHNILKDQERIHLLDPIDYPSLLFLMSRSTLIITDSGGIQEEAPTFGVPVIVTRTATERPEVLETDCARLCPLEEPDAFYAQAHRVLSEPECWQVSPKNNPFGDGSAASRIVEILEREI